jgi:hypothetical protein
MRFDLQFRLAVMYKNGKIKKKKQNSKTRHGRAEDSSKRRGFRESTPWGERSVSFYLGREECICQESRNYLKLEPLKKRSFVQARQREEFVSGRWLQVAQRACQKRVRLRISMSGSHSASSAQVPSQRLILLDRAQPAPAPRVVTGQPLQMQPCADTLA